LCGVEYEQVRDVLDGGERVGSLGQRFLNRLDFRKSQLGKGIALVQFGQLGRITAGSVSLAKKRESCHERMF
jgi:hypothetical protein